MKHKYYIFHKPFGVLSQFTDEGGNPGLGQFLNLPDDVYPVGRLDKDSEGLLFLTNNNGLKHRLLSPEFGHTREYWVQVDGEISDEAIAELEKPMPINYKGQIHITKPSNAKRIFPDVPERNPPVRFRKNIPTSWISLQLTEGKNKQVRKMTAAAGFPTLRLIRFSFAKLTINDLAIGNWRELSQHEVSQNTGIQL